MFKADEKRGTETERRKEEWKESDGSGREDTERGVRTSCRELAVPDCKQQQDNVYSMCVYEKPERTVGGC